MIADYEISRVPFFAATRPILRVQCLWCPYRSEAKWLTEDGAVWAFLQHFQAKHQK